MSNEIEKVNGSDNSIAGMINYAMQNGATIDQLEKFMALKERHEASIAKSEYVKAMSEFRANCVTIAKNKGGYDNRYKYAELSKIVEAISPVMVDCGLSHRWETKQEAGAVYVTCHITHIGGHSESTTMCAPPDTSGSKNNIQSIGSTITYLQRYTLASILGLAFSEDNDCAGFDSGEVLGDAMKEISACSSQDGLKAIFSKYGRIATDKKDRGLYRSIQEACNNRSNELHFKEAAANE